jgi:sulfide:quinone oxidoreductase
MPSHRPPKVIVAGGGIAAAETLLALRARMDGQVALELVAPDPVLSHRPSTVAEPFGLVGPTPVSLPQLARSIGATLRPTALRSVETADRCIRTADGDRLGYDALVIATGARETDNVLGATTFRGADGIAATRQALDTIVRHPERRLAFAAVRGWSLPAYELALLSAAWLRDQGVARPAISVVTPESAPLEIFGPEATEAIHDLLATAGVEVHAGSAARRLDDGTILLADGGTVAADACIALPRAAGPCVRGLPSDDHGFLPTDRFGAVVGVESVYAAGDVTAFPIKQGGLATQQADAVADAIAYGYGALRTPAAFRPVLRGLLLTGGAPLYLRAELTWAHGAPVSRAARRLPRRGTVSGGAMWWPPAKLAGLHLAAWFAGHDTLVDRPASQRAPDHDRALDLAMLMADAAADEGDFAGALHALDAAAQLSGGVLPATAARRREEWLARTGR